MKSARNPNPKKNTIKKNPPLQSSAIGTETAMPEAVGPIPKSKVSIVKPGVPSVHPFPVVAIGASAGGLEAVTQLLQNLAPDTGMAFIYVQHLSPDHKSLLTPLLSKVTQMKVQDIDDMEKIQPNNVYIIPHNKEIEVIDGHIQLLPRPVNKSSNLSIDVLFSSLAETHGENVVGIVLSGSANDGTRGLKEIKLAGGITFAQDDSAKFSSMPHSAIAEGVVDFVLSPKEIAVQLGWMSKHPLANPHAIKVAPEDTINNSDLDLKAVLQLIQKTKRVDFNHYKMNTIKRRMLRRMLIHKVDTVKVYAELLRNEKQEIDLLFHDLLINVTDFFRDAEAFEVLKTTVLPNLLKSKAPGETLRIWVAACATGEEAYSMGILLFELQEQKSEPIPFQIFASDLSVEAISKARAGVYTSNQLKNISPKRRQRFFTKSKDKFCVSKALRDVCVFAHHNILGDPPFSRMDFISCRNLLIYLDHPAQKKAIATFQYALNEGGILMLGKSETVGSATDLFTPLDKKYRIYTRKKNAGLHRIPDISSYIPHTALQDKEGGTVTNPQKMPVNRNNQLTNAFDAILLAQFVPASVIVNHDLDILQFRGNTAPYLQNAPGKASFNILKMAHPEITFELRNAIHHAIKTKLSVRKTGIEMTHDAAGNMVRIVNLEATPLQVPGEEPMVVVIFTGYEMEKGGYPVEGEKKNSIAKDRRIKKLEEELAAARYDMRSITQDQESANEELQSANEEVISSNEELQSLNEELETSKEEIESTNEELITSNQELHVRIQQVEELHNYNEVILDTVHEPMLVLDKHLHIKSANKSFCKTFRMTEGHLVGASLYKLGNHEWDIPQLRVLLEEIIPKNNRFHDFEVDISFPTIGHKIMLLNAHRIVQPSKNEALIVLTIIDVTEVRKLALEIELKEKELLSKALNDSIAVQQALEVAVAERTAAFEEQQAAKNEAVLKTKIAEDVVIAKQQFLSNMSHEIRTPMNAIIGFTNVILKTNLEAKQKEYINAIKESGDALLILINDILDLAKVDSGKMTFEQIPFNLPDAVGAMLLLFEARIQEKNITLIKEYDPAIPAVLIGDPMRLRQIILNLVSNAVKFTNAGQIAMRARLLEQTADKVTVEFMLSDTGIGIANDKLGLIFKNFEQAYKEGGGVYGGTGLGLAIVKQLIERQGGTIHVESELDKGSIFRFTLCFNLATEKANIMEKSAPEMNPEVKHLKVLVAEDMALNQLLIKLIVTEFGFEIDIANNGKMAIEMLQKNRYDVVLMDLQMPEMNGFDATEYIRKQMKDQIPIIALTADVTTVDLDKCLAIGMNDYISKPIDEQLLYSKIMKCLKKPSIV